MLSIQISGDRQLIARLHDMPEKLKSALEIKVRSLTMALEAKVKGKLSGEVLNVRSGELRSSIHSNVETEGHKVIGVVYSAEDSPAHTYAAAHEFGASIPERFPVNAKALHFFVDGKEIFAKHAAAFTLPERSYLRSSLEEMKEHIVEELHSTVTNTLREK